MRKYICLAFLFVSFAAYGQTQNYQIGIKLGPTFSNVKTKTDGTNTSINRDGSTVKFLVGAFVDLGFKENYFFHTGLNYVSKATKISITDGSFFGGTPFTEEYSHESLQIPLLLKLYTNEIFLDTKLFFNFGLVPELLLSTNDEDPANLVIEDFNTFGLSGNFGAGIEYAFGVNTSVYAGLNAYLGFLNVIKNQNNALDELNVKSNLISLEFGVKF